MVARATTRTVLVDLRLVEVDARTQRVLVATSCPLRAPEELLLLAKRLLEHLACMVDALRNGALCLPRLSCVN